MPFGGLESRHVVLSQSVKFRQKKSNGHVEDMTANESPEIHLLIKTKSNATGVGVPFRLL